MMQIMKKLLILEDDLTLQNILLSTFSTSYVTTVVGTLAAAYNQLSQNKFDIMIVDRRLPDGDGLELIEYMHDTAYQTKVLALTGRAGVADRVTGLEKGADEYLAKPFALAELKIKVEKLAQIEKIIENQSVLKKSFEFFPDTGIIVSNSLQLQLRRREAQIFYCLLRYANQVVTRQMLITDVWSGEEELPTNTTLDVYIRRLRVVLGSLSSHIITIRGFGYKFQD